MEYFKPVNIMEFKYLKNLKNADETIGMEEFNKLTDVEKTHIIARIIRRYSNAKVENDKEIGKHKPRKCFVCGEQVNIQNHHIIKVEWLAEFVLKNKLFFFSNPGYILMEKIPIPHVDLCKDEHIMIHRIMDNLSLPTKLTDNQIKKYNEMINNVDLSNYEGEWWYKKLDYMWDKKKTQMLRKVNEDLNKDRKNVPIRELISVAEKHEIQDYFEGDIDRSNSTKETRKNETFKEFD